MTQRLLIIIGLLCLFSVAQAQELTHPFTDDVLAEGVTVLDVSEPAHEQSPYPIEQSGDWRIRESETGHQLCNIVTEICTGDLPVIELYQPDLPPSPDCDATWDEDGFIAESPGGEWVIFSDCGTNSFPSFYHLFSYNLLTNELYDLGDLDLTQQIYIEGWVNDATPLINVGFLTGVPVLSLAHVDTENSFEHIARNYFYDEVHRTVYWTEYILVDGSNYELAGWEIHSRNLVSDESSFIFAYNYSEPRSAETIRVFVMDVNDDWITVTDSYRLSPEFILYLYDRNVDEVVFVKNRLAWLAENWTIGYETGTFWHWEYTFDGENDATNFTLIRSDISAQGITETEIMSNENAPYTYLSPDERHLLLASANGVQIYVINTNEIIPITMNTEALCRNCTIYGTWLSDGTIQLRMETYYSNTDPDVTVHIQIDALSGTDT